MPDVSALFDEYAAAFARGEEPDLREYLARAGEGADELARLVEAFVATAPAAEPSEERVALTRAWAEGQSPLLEARTRRGVRREEVVEAILGRFGIDSAKRQKVAGLLPRARGRAARPAARGSERLGPARRASALERERPAPATAPVTASAAAWLSRTGVRRRRRLSRDSPRRPRLRPLRAPEPPDEVDRLFRFGS